MNFGIEVIDLVPCSVSRAVARIFPENRQQADHIEFERLIGHAELSVHPFRFMARAMIARCWRNCLPWGYRVLVGFSVAYIASDFAAKPIHFAAKPIHKVVLE